MSELKVTDDFDYGYDLERSEAYRDIDLLSRLVNYDPTAPEAEHLRPRQSLAATRFCENGINMLQDAVPMEAMSVIHPTGSGKTVLATELIRIVASGETGHNVIMLVPSLQLLRQTAGIGGDLGEIRTRIPEISVGEYSGARRSTDHRVTVMNYHMLKRALSNGDLKKIDPKLIILDEAHHLIDGSWAEEIKQATEDVLTVALTATPMYSEERDSRHNFPVVLDHMPIREGIREGILSGIRGFKYEGTSRIALSRGDGKLTDEAIFQALATSKDNYLAASICADEIAQGKRGIISCSPGFDRLHAKIMQKILSQMQVETPEGRRFINAAYVDGSMDKNEIEDILHRYHKPKPEIDVIAFVSLLLEGWNSTATDFGVWLRPTPSLVLAEQRIGRLLRRREGKLAHVHEIIYELEGEGRDRQITLDDVLNGTGLRRGSIGRLAIGPRERYIQHTRSVDVNRFAINTELAAELGSQTPVAIQEEIIAPEKDIVPYDWPTIHVLSKKFDMTYEEVENVLTSANVSIAQDTTGNVTRTFYSPEAFDTLAIYKGINIGIPEGMVSVADIIHYCRTSDVRKIVLPEDLEVHLASLDFVPVACIDNLNITNAYPKDALNLLSLVPGRTIPKKKEKERASVPHVDIINWLSAILVNPKEAETPYQMRQIRTAQSCLVAVLKEDRVCSSDDIARLTGEVERLGIEPSPQMQNVMAANDIDFVQLLILSTRAKDSWRKHINEAK